MREEGALRWDWRVCHRPHSMYKLNGHGKISAQVKWKATGDVPSGEYYYLIHAFERSVWLHMDVFLLFFHMVDTKWQMHSYECNVYLFLNLSLSFCVWVWVCGWVSVCVLFSWVIFANSSGILSRHRIGNRIMEYYKNSVQFDFPQRFQRHSGRENGIFNKWCR